jgi:subtilisin family serine protease
MKLYQLLKKPINCKLKPITSNQNQEASKMKPRAIFKAPLTLNLKPLTFCHERSNKMKRNLLLLGMTIVAMLFFPNQSALLGINSANAGLSESFTGTTFPPDGWTVYNFDDDDAWSRYTPYYNTSPACARIYYDSTNNDWLITPRLSVTANDSLKFYYRVQSASYTETLLVRVSTSPIVSDTGSYTIISSLITNSTTWTQKNIGLSGYAGQNIYIAFHYACWDNYAFAIDDVTGPNIFVPCLAPNITCPNNETKSANGTYTTSTTWTATDPNVDTLIKIQSVTLGTLPPGITSATVNVTGPPLPAKSTYGTVTYTVGNHCLSGGAIPLIATNNCTSPLMDTCTFNVTLTNNPPVANCPGNATFAYNVGYSGTATATDPNGDAVTFSKVSGPAGLNVAANGAITWTTGCNDVGGPYTVVVRATDVCGATNNCSFQLTVTNATPTITCPPHDTTRAGLFISGNFSTNDPEGRPVTVSFVSITPPATNNPTIVGNHVEWFVSPSDPTGVYTIRLRVRDECGLTNECTFNVTVVPTPYCSQDTIDLGVCDTLNVETFHGDQTYEATGGYDSVRVAIYVTHDSNTFWWQDGNKWVQDSILAFVIPLNFWNDGCADSIIFPTYGNWNNKVMDPDSAKFNRSMFRHLVDPQTGDTVYNRFALMHEAGLADWAVNTNIVSHDPGHVFLALTWTGPNTKGWWEGERTLLATLTFLVYMGDDCDSTAICLDSTFWPPGGWFRFLRYDAIDYIPRHFLPACDTIYTPSAPPPPYGGTWIRDQNKNRLEDAIDTILSVNPDSVIDIIVGFCRRPTPQDSIWLNGFGNCDHIFKYIKAISVKNVQAWQVQQITTSKVVDVAMVQLDWEVTTCLDVSTRAIKARPSAEYSPGTAWDFGYTGDGKIFILDTGVDDDHPDLQGKFVAGYNALTRVEENPDDDNFPDFHGTHVAGIALGGDGDPQDDFIGVAYDAKLLDIKVLGSNGRGPTSRVIEGIEWCIDYARHHWGLYVANLSLSDNKPCDGTCLLCQAVDEAADCLANDRSMIVVVASGNLGDVKWMGSPAAAMWAITVGALDDHNTVIRDDDDWATFSQTGGKIRWYQVPDLVAPGVAIMSAMGSASGQQGVGYHALSGTSMAAPHVAGTAALAFRACLYYPPAVGAELKAWAQEWGEPGWDRFYGWGYVDAFATAVNPRTHIYIPGRHQWKWEASGIRLQDDTPTQGVPNTIFADIFNFGNIDAHNVEISFWIQYTGAGVPLSKWELLGSVIVDEIPKYGGHVIAQFPWTPAPLPPNLDRACIKVKAGESEAIRNIKTIEWSGPSAKGDTLDTLIVVPLLFWNPTYEVEQIALCTDRAELPVGWQAWLTDSLFFLAGQESTHVQLIIRPDTGKFNDTVNIRISERPQGSSAPWGGVTVRIRPPSPTFICGDANGDGVVNSADVVYLINYLFKGGPAPNPIQAGDVNEDGVINSADVVYLINYLFKGGPEPCEGKATGSPGSKSELYKGKAPAQIGFSSPTISKDSIFNVPLIGKFDMDIAAVELEIKYDPEEITLLEPALTSRTEGLQIYSSAKDGILKIGILDLRGEHYISAGTGALVNLRIRGSDLSSRFASPASGDASFTTSLEITKAILVDPDAQLVPVKIVSEMEKSEEDLHATESAVPQEFSLSQNYPNPFNPETEIKYALPTGCHVKLTIYNIAGQKVKTLVDEYQTAGYKTIHWNGRADKGEEIATGVYFYKIQAGDFRESRKMVLVK